MAKRSRLSRYKDKHKMRVKRRNPVAKAVSTGIHPPRIINPEVNYKRHPKHKGDTND